MVLGCDGFCFPQRSRPLLNLKIFISSDAFYNSMFFYPQLEFTWLRIQEGKAQCPDAQEMSPVPSKAGIRVCEDDARPLRVVSTRRHETKSSTTELDVASQ
jgi:hypothetical protein